MVYDLLSYRCEFKEGQLNVELEHEHPIFWLRTLNTQGDEKLLSYVMSHSKM